MHDDDVIFDNPAAVREMRRRHAAIGRRALAIVSAALAEWEARIANGEALNMSLAEIEQLREIGMKMAREDSGHEADAPEPTTTKPN
jgi:hypothetical protein